MNPLTDRFWSMDSYEGEPDDPIGLHKYLYCEAEPISNIGPTGNITMSEVMSTLRIIGQKARDVAVAAYRIEERNARQFTRKV